MAKGYFGRKKNVWTVAKNQVEKGWTYAYRDRRNKKREFRKLWIQRINAGARQHGTSYSQFMGKVNSTGVALNRKVLADLAMNHPDAFKAVFDFVMSAPAKVKEAPAAPVAPVVEAPKEEVKPTDSEDVPVAEDKNEEE
jgi:large subunit ribosomal protein L20